MEVTIDCPCGETYVFDIEPVDGQMPTGVNCPTCGADGTELANEFIAEHLNPNPPRSSLRLQKQEPPVEEQSLEDFAEPVPEQVPLREDVSRSSLLLGSFGAVLAGAIGMGAWYILIKVTGYELGIAAWGIGVFIGFAALLLAKGGSNTLGLIAGACALVAIIGGQFLVMKTYLAELMDEFIPGTYDEQMIFAQEAVAAENDEELRRAIWGDYPDFDASFISDEELADFRTEDLPELREFINGTPTREEYEESLRESYGSPETNLALLKDSFSLFTLLWLFLGVGSAYKLGRGGDGT